MKLKPVPYVQCTNSKRETAIPWLKENVGHPIEDKERVLSYLDQGPAISSTFGLETDILAEPRRPIMDYLPTTKTDGVWAWIYSMAYWVKEYDLRLPAEFLDHVRSNDYRIDVPEAVIAKFRDPNWKHGYHYFRPRS